MSKTTNYLRNYIRKVTSQNGEEGVIEFLLNKIYDNELSSQDNLQLCDIGSGDGFFLSNSYYFIKKYNFEALMVEAREIDLVTSRKIFENDKVHHENIFIDKTNTIDQVLKKHNFKKDIDLLSIDIDGQDYHLFKQLEIYRPKLIIVECNMTARKYIRLIEDEGANNGVGSSALSILELGNKKNYKLCLQLFNNLIFIDEKYFHKVGFPNEYDEMSEIHDIFPLDVFQDHYGNIHILNGGPWKFNKIIRYDGNLINDDTGGVHQINDMINLNQNGRIKKLNKFNYFYEGKYENLDELVNFRNNTRDAQYGLNTHLNEPQLLQHNQSEHQKKYENILKKKEIIFNSEKYKLIDEKVIENKEIIVKEKKIFENHITDNYLEIKIECKNDGGVCKLILIDLEKDKINDPIEFQIKHPSDKTITYSAANTSQMVDGKLFIFMPSDVYVGDMWVIKLSNFNYTSLDRDIINSLKVFYLKK